MIDNHGISKKLKSYFNSIGMSQKDISSSLGVSQQAVGALLNGKPFGKRTAIIWGEKFAIKSNWLLTGEGDMLKTDQIESKSDSEQPTDKEEWLNIFKSQQETIAGQQKTIDDQQQTINKLTNK